MTTKTIKCPKCGGEMDVGGIGGLSYASNHQRKVLPRVTQANTAHACFACGYVELFLDPDELRKRLQK